MLEKTGIPTEADVCSVFPPTERLMKGPVAIIECFQRIPCNPCSTACRKNAIQTFGDINDLPRIDFDNCNGCGLCMSHCPGLAIMVVDVSWSANKALIKLPYEFLPLPNVGDIVAALNRAGEYITDARVVNVLNTPSLDHTSIVSLEIDREYVMTVRNFRQKSEPEISNVPEKATEAQVQDVSIVCRCNDLDINYIRGLISDGFTSVDEIKRVSRLGMGPCQGRNCIPLVMTELSRATGTPIANLNPGTFRPITRSVPLGTVADYLKDGGDTYE